MSDEKNLQQNENLNKFLQKICHPELDSGPRLYADNAHKIPQDVYNMCLTDKKHNSKKTTDIFYPATINTV